MDESVGEEIETPFHYILIKIDPDLNSPEIDLGKVPPHAAIVFFRQAAQTLEDLLIPPSISFDGEKIFEIIPDD